MGRRGVENSLAVPDLIPTCFTAFRVVGLVELGCAHSVMVFLVGYWKTMIGARASAMVHTLCLRRVQRAAQQENIPRMLKKAVQQGRSE